MEKIERDKLYQWAMDKWGKTSQLDQMIEEMAELTVAINKYKRMTNFIAQKKDGVIENLYEELADVKMCLEQMEYLFGKEKIESAMEIKLQKFLKQLQE